MVTFKSRAILAIVVACLVVYAPSLRAPFLFDDMVLIVSNESLRSLWPPWAAINTCRPLVDLSLALNYALGGLDTLGYHVFNVLIHMGAGLALFALCRKAFRLPSMASYLQASADNLSFAIALIWAVHPLHTESVTYTIQRAEAMAGLFYFATLYAYLRFQSSGRKKWAAASVAACALGTLSKATIVTAPIMIILFDRAFISSSWKAVFEKKTRYFLVLLSTYGLLVLAYALPFYLGWYASILEKSSGISFLYLANQCLVIWRYIGLMFWPSSLCIDYYYDLLPANSLIFPCVAMAVFFLAALAYVRRHPKPGFLALWFFITLASTSSIFYLNDIMAERRTYLPLVSVVVVFVLNLFSPLRKKMNLFMLTAILVASLLGYRTILRNSEYLDLSSFWKSVLEVNPHNFRAWSGLAEEQIRRGEFDQAAATLQKCIQANPVAAQELAYTGDTVISFPVPKFIGSDRELNQRYFAAGAFSNLGIYYLNKESEDAAALKYLISAVHLYPWDADHYFNLGVFMEKQGKNKNALEYYRMALMISRHHDRALLAYKRLESGPSHLIKDV